jgi:CRP-like cAMP-binding protein
LVKSGQFEVIFVDSKGEEFVFERLGSGAILNHRNWFFKEERMDLTVRCSSRAAILILNINELTKLAINNDEINRLKLMAMNKISKSNI